MEFECPKSIEVSKDCCEEQSEKIAENQTEKGLISIPNLELNSEKGFTGNEELLLSNYRRSITDLPPALVSEILNCLGPKELGIISCVSTNLHRLASDHHVWKEFYCERWGLPFAPAPSGLEIPNEKTWKELFVERDFRSRTFMGRHSIDVLHGHTEAVRAVFLLASAKLIFTSGYDMVVKIWDLEEGLSIASSQSLGCTIRSLVADMKLLVAGSTDGFIHCWKAEEGLPHLFDIRGSQNRNNQFRLWEHQGPVSSLALDLTRIYSGSWDMTVRIWARSSPKCLMVLMHRDWVWGLAPHGTTVASASGSDVYVWDTSTGARMNVIHNAHHGGTYCLARSHTGDLLFTGGEDGAIHMFEISSDSLKTDGLKFATWMPHTGPVHSLAFEFPWLVSASSDGKLSLVDVRKLLRTRKDGSRNSLSMKQIESGCIEPPHRMLHGFGSNLFSVGIGADRIVCGGEEGVVRIWNFSQALEIEERVRASRAIRAEHRMRRRKLRLEMNGKGGCSSSSSSSDQCSVAAAKKNSINGERNGVWLGKHRMSSKVKA